MVRALLPILILLTTSPDHQLFQYIDENVSSNFKALDRSSVRDRINVAATGFTMTAWAIGTQQKYVSREISSYKIRGAFLNTVRDNPPQNKGWLYHWTKPDGSPYYFGSSRVVEISSIDTAIFYAGAKRAAQILGDDEFLRIIQYYQDQIDQSWMIDGPTGYFRHGYIWNEEGQNFTPIPYLWDNYSEGVILYRLFNKKYEPKEIKYDLPLFAYYYPCCFFDDPDHYMTDILKGAISYQEQNFGVWGLTSGDTETKGYQPFDADTISPLTIFALSRFRPPNYDIPPAQQLTPSFNLKTKWEATDRIGIDDGACFILLNSKNLKEKDGEQIYASSN